MSFLLYVLYTIRCLIQKRLAFMYVYMLRYIRKQSYVLVIGFFLRIFVVVRSRVRCAEREIWETERTMFVSVWKKGMG